MLRRVNLATAEAAVAVRVPQRARVLPLALEPERAVERSSGRFLRPRRAITARSSWRTLPKEFSPWQNVYRSFRRWSEQGKFKQIHDRLRAMWREREGRADAPTAAVLDAQSTRSSPQGGEHGYDAGNKVKGRKRHLIVDTLGLLLAVSVSAASVQDRDGAHRVVNAAMDKYPGIAALDVDGGYAGQCAQTVSQRHDIEVQVVRYPANRNVGRRTHPEQPDLFTVKADADGFVVLPKRWVIERTHAWNGRSRRLIIHHDRLRGLGLAG
jgi:transposase